MVGTRRAKTIRRFTKNLLGDGKGVAGIAEKMKRVRAKKHQTNKLPAVKKPRSKMHNGESVAAFRARRKACNQRRREREDSRKALLVKEDAPKWTGLTLADVIHHNEPCDHPGCLHHVTHPCEGCGRIGGVL